VLFDHSAPRGTKQALSSHQIAIAKDLGWDTLSNGELLAVAEEYGFDVLLTADKNIRYQQNLTGRRIAIVVLSTPRWPDVRKNLDQIAEAIANAKPGSTRS